MFSILKLNAINSTNSYLKDLNKACIVKNATVVVVKTQYAGRGQRQEVWQSESGKNITFSVLYRFKNFELINQFYLNCAVSSAIYKAIFPIIGNDLSIKWPNDIMAGNKKLGGILIENTVKNGFISHSIIGIGLNINQTIFPKSLSKATSINLMLNKEFNLDNILNNILKALADKIKLIELKSYKALFNLYHKNLYRINVWSDFIDINNQTFKGKIKRVNLDGTLSIEFDNGKLKSFASKTIRFL